jgi:hypothetical protein
MPHEDQMKLKVDEAGHVVVSDGKPVYVHDDGREIPFDAPATVATIARLNGEAKGHREAKEALEAKVKAFEGIDDPAAAMKALETVKSLDAGQLVQAGKVDEIKAAAVKAYEEQAKAAAKAHADEMARVKAELEALTGRYHGEKIAAQFAGSKYIADKIAVPADMIKAAFGSQFKVEADGKVVAYDPSGNKMYSLAKPGELADFDEALEMLVGSYAHRDHILKGSGASGSGARGSSGTGGTGKTMPRAQFEAMNPMDKAKAMADGLTVTD